MINIRSCPKCGGNDIAVYAIAGGMNYDLTEYTAECQDCELRISPIVNDGTRRSAIRAWNRFTKGKEWDLIRKPKKI